MLEIAINIEEEDEQDDVYNWQVLAEFIRLFEQNLILPTWLLCSFVYELWVLLPSCGHVA